MNRTLAGGWSVLVLFAGCGFGAASSPDAGPTTDADDGPVVDADRGDGGDDAGPQDAAVDAPPDAVRVCATGDAMCTGRDRLVCKADRTGFELDRTCGLTCEPGGVCTAASNLPVSFQAACLGGSTTRALVLTGSAEARIVRTGGDVTIECTGSCAPGESSSIPATRFDASGAPLAAFCLRDLAIAPGAMLVGTPISAISATADSHPAIAIFVAGTAVINGTIRLDGEVGGITLGGAAGLGGGMGGSAPANDVGGNPGQGTCPGSGGTIAPALAAAGGGGGGGGGGTGGAGGDGVGRAQTAAGGPGGGVCTPANLMPLRGGSGGGSGADGNCAEPCGRPGGGGAGALQIAATSSISTGASGVISASGGAGASALNGASQIPSAAGGGGAGGGVLLEAPTMTLAGSVLVLGGGSGSSVGGAGGTGAGTGLNGGDGADLNLTGGGPGGGAAAGRVRLNTATFATCPANAAFPVAACSVGVLVLE